MKSPEIQGANLFDHEEIEHQGTFLWSRFFVIVFVLVAFAHASDYAYRHHNDERIVTVSPITITPSPEATAPVHDAPVRGVTAVKAVTVTAPALSPTK